MLMCREIRQFQSYDDMAIAHQKDVDDFPVCWIFGSKTTEEIKEELFKALGTRKFEDVMKSPYGGIIRKSDYEDLEAMFAHHATERKHFWENEDNLTQAIVREMYNHEFGYTQVPMDTLMALGKTANAFLDEKFARCWDRAKKKVLKEAA